MQSGQVWSHAAAWAVHAYTASGTVLGLLIVLAAVEGDVRMALWLTLAALVIDGTDGMLARSVKVKERIPWFDGARLDDIVDYLTYAFAPMVLLWTGGHLGSGVGATVLAAVPLLASSFQFCRVDAKTDDHFFLGFPSYWNVVAFYVIVLDLQLTAVTILILACTVLVFVPVRYVYPSRTQFLQAPTLALTAVWLVSYAVLLAQLPSVSTVWVTVSLGYLVYYVALSLHLTLGRWRADRVRRAAEGEYPPAEAGATGTP